MATSLQLRAVEAGGLISEDVIRELFNISPVQRPLIDSIGRTTAKNTKKEFTDEVLSASSATNTLYENQNLSAVDNSILGQRYYNWCQQEGKVIKSSQRARDIDTTYGEDEFLHQLMRLGEVLRTDEEAAAVSRNAATAEVAATSGALMAGLATWCIRNTSRGAGGADAVLDGATNVGGGPTTAPVAGTGRGFTETLMRAALRAGWNDGAQFDLLMSTADMIENIAGYMYTSSARVAAMQTDLPQNNRYGVGGLTDNGAKSAGMVAQGSVNMFVGNFGAIILTPNRHMTTYTSGAAQVVDVLFIDSRYPKMAYLHDYDVQDLDRDGLYDQRALYVDSCFIPCATRSITTVADILPGTAMV